jgi:GTP-binding protein EngB required for normal cell division
VTDFPPETVPELAFAGALECRQVERLNALAGRKRLAFASKRPAARR